MTRGGMIAYVNANGIPVVVRFDRDTQTAFRFDAREWEVGVRAHRPFGWYPDKVQRSMLGALQAENPHR